MAAKKTNKKCALKLKVEVGTTSSGVAKYGTRTITDINPDLTDDDMQSLGTSLAALQTYPVSDVQRTDTASLVTA